MDKIQQRLKLEQDKVTDLEDRLQEETVKHMTFKAQLQDKVNALRMEVSQRQKEYSESQKGQLEKNRALVRENKRLKDEIRLLRQEMGLKPVPDPIQSGSDICDDECAISNLILHPK